MQRPFVLAALVLLSCPALGSAAAITNTRSQVSDSQGEAKLVAQLLPTTNQEALQILKRPPFTPNDGSLFTPQTYGSAPTQPAAAYVVNEAQIKRQLRSIFTQRFGGDATRIAQGMAIYNNPQIAQLVPDPRLRAAIASLQGTAGQAAIAGYRSGIYVKVSFGDTNGSPAKVLGLPGSNKAEIVVDQDDQYEDFRLFAPSMAHEPLHHDPTNSGKEELIANSIDALIYGQYVLETPSLAHSRTLLSRRFNTEFLARLSSRDTQGKLRLFQAQGNVFPGGQIPLANFGALFPELGVDTPGNSVLKAMLPAVTGKSLVNPGFNNTTLSLLDQNQRVLSPIQLVQLANILNLNTL